MLELTPALCEGWRKRLRLPPQAKAYAKLSADVKLLQSDGSEKERDIGQLLTLKKAPQLIMSGFGTFPTFNLERVFHSHEAL